MSIYFVLFYHFCYSSLHWLIQGPRECWHDFTVTFAHREIFCFLSVVVRFWNSRHWCSTCHVFPSSVRHLHPHRTFLLTEDSLLLILGIVRWHKMTNQSGEGWVLLALYGIKAFRAIVCSWLNASTSAVTVTSSRCGLCFGPNPRMRKTHGTKWHCSGQRIWKTVPLNGERCMNLCCWWGVC